VAGRPATRTERNWRKACRSAREASYRKAINFKIIYHPVESDADGGWRLCRPKRVVSGPIRDELHRLLRSKESRRRRLSDAVPPKTCHKRDRAIGT
jgi:hypothetical protein